MYVILKVQCERNWWGIGSLSVFWYAQMEKSSFRSLISVPLESSVLGVREGRVRGSRWYFSPRALYVIGVAQTWSSIPELCVRAERGWCRGDVKALVCVLVWLVEVFVGLYVEPVERSERRTLCTPANTIICETFCSTNKKHVSPLQSILTQFSIRYL